MDDILTTTEENDNPKNIRSSDDRIDNLIQLLNKEIENIKDERQQPGWTIWALGGSLATMFWLLLNEIEKGVVYIV